MRASGAGDWPRISQPTDDVAFVQDPYPFYARARALGPFVWWDELGMVAATTHAAVSACLKDRRLGRVPPLAPAFPDHLADFARAEAHSLLELEPPRHTELRGLVLRAFTSRRIASLAPEIEALANALVDAFPTDPHDLLKTYAQPLPVRIIARLLGVPEDAAPDLLRWSNAMVRMYQPMPAPEAQHAANAAARAFSAFLRDHIDHRRRTPGDDLISELIAARDNGNALTEAEMISTCILLLNAGHEATVHTIGNAVQALLAHGHRDISDVCVEELLRFDPPLHLFTRWVNDDVDIAGTRLPRGTEVACLLGSGNRDPLVFADPDTFDPARDARRQVAFGAGLHFCVGAPLARLEIRIALTSLFARCPDLSLATPPRFGDTYHFHGLESLIVQTA